MPFTVKLELAKASQVIEVTSQAPLVQTATSDLGFQIDSSTIQHAALVDRDVFDVLPFMAPSVSMGLDMTPTSGGAREAGTSYMLNGAEDNNNFSAGALNIAVVSANQKSGTNKFHAVLYEQHRDATLNANDFFYNRDLGASKGTANPLPNRPKYIKNQFGGAIGGPIKKDKTFFFFTYDRFKLFQGFTQANNFEPTSTALAFAKANGGPLAQQMLAAYPPITSDSQCPGVANTGGTNAVGCLSFSDPVTTTTDSYYGRVDHNFSNSDRLSFAANISRNTVLDKYGNFLGAGGSILAGFGNIPGTNTINQHNLALIETHTFGPRVANELTLSHNRYFNPTIEGNPAKQTAPNILIDNQTEGCLAYSFGPFEGVQIISFVQDRWALQDNLSWMVGHHALKVGGSANYGILYRNWDLGLPGQYEFGELTAISNGTNSACPVGTVIKASCDGTSQGDGTITGLSSKREKVTNFTGDYPYFEETSVDPRIPAPNKAVAYRHYTSHDYAVFGQDDWKATSRLTLNLGLRWERFGAPAEAHGNIAQLVNFAGCDWAHNAACIAAAVTGPVSRMWNTQNHDFGPRVGFAWDPMGKGKMAIRGGYGIFYDRIFDNIWSNGAWNPPFYALLDFSADGGDAIFYSSPASIGPGYNPAGPCGPIPYAPGEPAGCASRKRVSVRTMDVNMHDSSGQNFYLGVERQFFGSLLFSAKFQGSFGRHLPMLQFVNRVDGDGYNSSLTPVRPNGIFTGFNYRSNSVSSNYNALIVEAKKNMGHGLQFDTSYTFSKALDVNSELFAGCSTIGAQSAPYYYISNALPRLSYGRGAEDHRHAYKFNVTYDLPFLKAEKGLVGHTLGGWSLGSFFQFYSGHPVDVYDGRSTYPALDAAGNSILDANGIPINMGGDYNLDRVNNDHPIFIGGNIDSVYSNGSPANGIFRDNNIIGCGAPWAPANADIATCNANFGVAGACAVGDTSCNPAGTGSIGTPNSMFVMPGYPKSGPLYARYGTLGRDVFHGPRFVDLDLGVHKTFRLTESVSLRFSAEAQNLANHPNFDAIDVNLGSSTFGQAQIVDGGAGLPTQKSRVMSLSLRLAF